MKTTSAALEVPSDPVHVVELELLPSDPFLGHSLQPLGNVVNQIWLQRIQEHGGCGLLCVCKSS